MQIPVERAEDWAPMEVLGGGCCFLPARYPSLEQERAWSHQLVRLNGLSQSYIPGHVVLLPDLMAMRGSISGTLCRIDDIHPESNTKILVVRAEDWLYLCAIFSDL